MPNGIAFGPRVIVSEDALRATGLLVPGSLVRWSYRLRLPDGSDRAAGAVTAAAGVQLPDSGWQIRGRTNATPALERNVEHFTQFLTLVGLTALLVGGVGVANAVKSHIDRKRDVIATLKALGASGGRVFAIYLWQVLLLSAAGAAIGLAAGAVLPFAIAAAFGTIIPLPIAPALQPVELALAFFYGLLTALAFALWPLGRAHDVPVSALFRDAVSPGRRWPRRRYVVASALVVAALATIAVTLSYDRKIALIFVAAAAAVFVMLQLVAILLMAVARRLPHSNITALRLAIANIHRPGALTPTIVLSLGLGLALLVTVIEIDGNLRRQFEGALPDKAPSFYFIDIQSADSDRFDAFVRKNAPEADLERVPMLRGRIMSANGIKADDIKAQPNAAWVLQSDRGITFATDVPRGSTVVEGNWWGADYRGPPLVSFEKKIADGLGLKVGDPITVNVLGRNIEARIGNLRSVNWENLGINFVLVFSPSAFAGAPHTDIATLTYPGGGTLGAGNRAAESGERYVPGDHHGAGQGCDRGGRRHRAQSRARGARRQHGGARRRDAGARRRAGGRSQLSRVRRGGAEDARRNARETHWRLCAGIPAARRSHRAVRRRGRLDRGVACRHARDESHIRLAAGPGGGCGIWRASCHGCPGPDRHVHRARS